MSWFSKRFHAVTHAVDKGFGAATRGIDITNRRSALRTGARRVASIPGLGSAVAITSGGIGFLDSDIRKYAQRDFAIGAAVGGTIVGAPQLGNLAGRALGAIGQGSPAPQDNALVDSQGRIAEAGMFPTTAKMLLIAMVIGAIALLVGSKK